jgi:tetratricopeptide (TPR) repeat protein
MGRVLDLDDALAGDLFERTRGNPLFSLEFVRWWADRGALTSSALGFAVSREGADEVPTSVMDVARERAAKALGHPERRRLALTLATLADPLDPQELGALMGADAEERAQRLSELALLEPTRQGWRFDYATLREALLEMRDAEETRDANIACADALRSLERFGEAHWRRILDHELAAGRPEVALEDAREYIPSTHPRQSRALLRHLESRLEGSRETRGIIALYDAWVAKIEGDMDAMHAHLAHVRSVGPSDDVLERADVLELAYLIDASDYEAAEEKARAFAARLEGQDGKLARLATCLETLADALIYQGRPDEAVPVIERTLEIYTGDSPARDLQQAGWAHYNMANAHEEASRYDLALEHCERAQAIFEPFGDDSGVGSCELMRGHIWTSHGNLEDATQAHARALELMERCGDGMFVYALFGLARCWLERARLDEARAVLDRLDTLRGENDFVEGTRDLEVWCAALEGDQARAIALLREEGAAWSEGAGEHLARARAVSRTRGMSALAQALDEHMERLDEGQ